MHMMSEYLHGDDYSSVLFQYIYEKSLAKKKKKQKMDVIMLERTAHPLHGLYNYIFL